MDDISAMMLEVLDRPTKLRIILITKYPNLSTESDNVYFMIDRSDGGCTRKIDENGNPMFDEKHNHVWEDAKIYDYWKVSDSTGQFRIFKSNVELIEFLDSIEDVITDTYVDSF